MDHGLGGGVVLEVDDVARDEHVGHGEADHHVGHDVHVDVGCDRSRGLLEAEELGDEQPKPSSSEQAADAVVGRRV